MFKQYAEHLKGEATDELEYLASQLVSLKAAFLSQHIVEFRTGNDVEREQKNPKIIEKLTENLRRSHEEGEETYVEDIYFDNPVALHNFLVNSNAIQTFYTEIENFAFLRSIRTTNGNAMENDISSIKTKIAIFARYMLHNFKECLIAAGYLEPPLEPGMVRLRWECVSHLESHVYWSALERLTKEKSEVWRKIHSRC